MSGSETNARAAPTRPCCRWVTPERFLTGMLAVEGVLLLSEPFRWLGFGWWKGHRDLKVSITNHLPAAGKVGEVDREKLGLRKIKRNNRHSCKDVLYKRFTSGPAFWSVGPLSTPISNSAAVTAARAGGE